MIINNAAIHDVGQTWEAAYQDIFLKHSAQKPWPLFTRVIPAKTATVEQIMLALTGTVREHTHGPKVFSPAKAFRQTIAFRKFHDGLELDWTDLKYDVTGAVGQMFSAFMTNMSNFGTDKIVFDNLVSASGAGATGMDSAALISTAHPRASGSADQSNKTTSALSHATYDTAYQAMVGFTGHNDEPLGMVPTHLVVGPKLAKQAQEITQSTERLVGLAGDGTVDGGTRVAAATIPNVYGGGKVTLIVWDRLSGTQDDYWYLMDLSKASKPMALALQMDWVATVLDQMDAEGRFHNDKIYSLVEAHMSPASGAWPTIYGGIL